MNCLRCEIPMIFQGTRQFREGAIWGNPDDMGGLLSNKDSVDVYACPSCGKVEFFISGHQKKYRDLISPPDNITIARKPNHVDVDQMLKIIPGESTLEDVQSKLGESINFRRTRAGLYLYFSSLNPKLDHFLLVNESTEVVILNAISNESDYFLVEDLERQYGVRDIVGVIEGNEHWFFTDQHVSIVLDGREDSNIMYVMFLSALIDFDRYFDADGYSDAFSHQL